jgi:hypothetical protein
MLNNKIFGVFLKYAGMVTLIRKKNRVPRQKMDFAQDMDKNASALMGVPSMKDYS